MHALPWELKRAHWGMTWTAIRAFREAGAEQGDAGLEHMTPARFDVIFVIWQRPVWFRRGRNEPYDMALGEMKRRLGLHTTTVWKCVKRMEELGFLRCEPDDRPRRVRVYLTEAGLDAFERAAEVMGGSRFLEHNRYFAERIRLERVRRRRRKLDRPARERPHRAGWVLDAVLRTFAFLLRICAQGHRSWSFPVYDPTFDDPIFRVRYGYRRDTPPGWGR